MYKIFTLKFIPYVSSVCFLNLSTCLNYGIITSDEMQDSARVLIESDNRDLLGYYKDHGLIMNIYTHVRRRAR